MPVRGNTFKIFIGNLSDRTTSDDLRQLFEVHGTVVEADAVKNFGFVHMQSEEERKAAIESLNGFSLHGKAIVVESSTGAKKGNRQYTKIFVGNVPKDAKIEEIRALFEAYGRVVEADLLTNYAFIHMDCEDHSKEAIRNLDGYELSGVRLRVQESTSRVRQTAGMGNPDLCYRCGSAGHWSKECPRDSRYGGGSGGGGGGGGYGRGGGGGPGRMSDRGDRMGRGGRGGRMMERVDRMPRGGYGAPRYDPYPPPPPSFGRERMIRYREEYDPFDRYDRCYMRSTLYERSYDRMPQPPPMPEEMYDRRAILPPRGPDYISYGRRSPPPRYPPPPPAMGSAGGYGPIRGGPEGRPF